MHHLYTRETNIWKISFMLYKTGLAMPLIICQKQSFADVLQKEFLKNVTNLTGKHLCVAGLSPISQKNTCVGVSFPFRGLLLICLLFKFQGPYSSVSTVFVNSRYSSYFIWRNHYTNYEFRHSWKYKKEFWNLFTITTMWLRSENGSNHWKGHWTLIGKKLYLKYG